MERVKIYRNGQPLSQIKVGKYIRKELHLSKKAYQKYYDITRNKLRNYERATGSKPQSVLQFLYNRARFKARARSEGLHYTKSYKARYIEQFSSRSSGKRGYGVLEQKRINIRTEKYIKRIYGGLISKSDYANKISKEIKDPQLRLKALTEFADKRKELIKDSKGEVHIDKDKELFGGKGYISGDIDESAYNDIIEKYGGSGIG